jgi:hypothetical protein
MTRGDAEAIARAVGAAVREHVAREIGGLLLRVKSLEERDRKSIAGVRWCGTFKAGQSYVEGSLTTDRGSLWLARGCTSVRPGDGSDWVLVCKNGSHRERTE